VISILRACTKSKYNTVSVKLTWTRFVLLHCPPLPHWCRIVHSCKVRPCHMVPHCPFPQCPPLPYRADLSTPAMSTLAISCRYVHSCIFHTPIFDRAALSTPANSINQFVSAVHLETGSDRKGPGFSVTGPDRACNLPFSAA